MRENSYIQVLIQSLHQKVEALDSIIEKIKSSMRSYPRKKLIWMPLKRI